LNHLSRGRYPTSDSQKTEELDYQEARRIAKLLQLHSIYQAQENQGDDAVSTTLGLLNAGRSIGDEPSSLAQLVRMSCEILTVLNIERVLAQTEPSGNALEAAQKLFEDEASQPLLLIQARGERAHSFAEMENEGGWFLHLAVKPRLLELHNKCVEAAKRTPEEQISLLQELKKEPAAKHIMVSLWFSSHEKLVQVFVRNQAWLRCTYVGLAVERYRLAHNRWPDKLASLVAEFIRELPADPYNGAPLKYRRLDDGVVIYSVGPDGQDNGGKLDRQNPTAQGTDIGFQLWDVPQRRQPWRPTKKAEVAEKRRDRNDKEQ
jgi:hypothetical protein